MIAMANWIDRGLRIDREGFLDRIGLTDKPEGLVKIDGAGRIVGTDMVD